MADPGEGLRAALADRYIIERELGRGGMATVYLAQDVKHDRPVALKVLHPELAASLGPDRFLREIKLAARLQHPHILTVLDSGETVVGRKSQVGSHTPASTPPTARPVPARYRAVAVLPFQNVGDSADAYFADGMTDAVRGKLTALPTCG